MGTVVVSASDTEGIKAALRGTAKRGRRGGGKPPVDSKTRARVRKLARAGKSRNAIAREVGISASSVSKICAEARPPILFDRAAAKAATEARSVDLKARRQELARLLIQDAFDLRERAWGTKTIKILSPEMVDKGITEPVEFEVDYEAREIQQLFTSLAIAADKHLVLIRHDSDGSTQRSDLDAFLEHLTGGSR